MLANSKGQSLAMHSVGVAKVAMELFNRLNIEESNLLKRHAIENLNKFKESIFFAGLFHDIGKIDPNFQKFLNQKQVTDYNSENTDGVHYLEKETTEKAIKDDFSFLNYPRHNEVSWALCTYILSKDKIAQYAIYYHHAKIKRTINGKEIDNFNSNFILKKVFTDENIKIYCNNFINGILDLNNLEENLKNKITSISDLISDLDTDCANIIPPDFLFDNLEEIKYKKEEDYRNKKDINEIKNLLVRSLVVSADRIVSALEVKELIICIENNEWMSVCDKYNSNENNELKTIIDNMLDGFKIKNEANPENRNRDIEQEKIADKLSMKKDVSVLFGPAGCGKTKIFLEWYSNKQKDNIKSKKLFIITPRKMICKSLFNELRKEEYIPNAKIELITGDDKLYWNGSDLLEIESTTKIESNIVITTIDQLISVMLSHKKIDMLLDFLNSYVVFDEFHEFFNIPGIVIIFKLFIKMKKMLNDSNTLLVSATPNYYFLESILGLNIEKNLEYIDTFNKEKYKISFSKYVIEDKSKNQLENSQLYKQQNSGTIVIFNTAKDSQLSTIKVNNEKVINFHSKFTPMDKKDIYNEIIKQWGNINPMSDKILRAGPIVQASLNISTMNLITQVCSAENWCQRIGRANRFASKTNIANVVTVLSDKTLLGETVNNNEMKFLQKLASKEQTFAWINYLKNENFKDNENLVCELRLSDIYTQYKKFHSLKLTKESYNNDFQIIVEKSIEIFKQNDFTPLEYFKAKTKLKSNKMSTTSIRGLSVYVLPVCYDIYTKKIGDWLYLPSIDVDTNKLLTMSEKELNGSAYINNQKEILKNSLPNGFLDATYTNKKNYGKISDVKVKYEAKNASSPILLSYTSDIYGYEEKNKSGQFYITKGNVVVGLFPFKDL